MNTTPRTDAEEKLAREKYEYLREAGDPNFDDSPYLHARTLETELASMKARAEKAEAECLEQARLLGLSGNEVAALRSTVFRLNSLWHQFFFLLDITEESDSGNAFKPNYFSSCRIADAESMEKILTKAKHELNAGVNKQDL
jgi:hypothetical protein